MARKKILWLCSWYPGKTDPFNGDFIQRHAQAAALYNDIYVIHIAGDARGRIKETETEIREMPGLTEHIVYYKRSDSFTGKIAAFFRWRTYCNRAIREYMERFGEPDAVHVHIPMRMGLIAMQLKKKYGIPYVLSEHWGIYNDVELLNYTSRSSTFKKYTRDIFREAAVFISVSRYLAQGVNRLVLEKRFEVIPNAVNTAVFHEQGIKAVPDFRFIHVSNMVPIKNAEGLLRAFKLFLQQNRDAELVMVGDTEPGIRQLATELGLDRVVRFRGEIPYEKVAVEMQAAHCLVLFSNMENSPCVIGEALCCGLPVIATEVGGIPELLDETNGIQVAPGQEASLAAAMEQVKNNYPFYQQEPIAEKARQQFSYPVVGQQFDDVYKRLTKSKVQGTG